MLTPGTPQCLTPTQSINNKRSNVLLRVPEEMINYAPLESMKIPKNQKIRQSFSKFLCGNINEQEFVKFKCFPTTYGMPDQVVKKQRNRQEDLTLQIKRQAAIEKARQRWRKLAFIVKQNIQLRRELGSYYQTKILNRIELGLKIQNQLLQQNIVAEDMKNYKLRTMTILKEKKMKQSQSCFIPPKHYHFLLQEQFREQSDEYLFIYHKNLPNTKTLSDKQYNILLDTYLNKKKLFDQYQEEQKLRKIVKWKQSNNVSTFYSSNMSCQSNGLNREKPMQRLSNPLASQQGQRNHELKLINQISETDNAKLTVQTKTKKYLRQSHIKQKLDGIVKHNRIQSMDLGQSEIDDGLDMSNASISEALLDQLYLGSQKLQEKLKSKGYFEAVRNESEYNLCKLFKIEQILIKIKMIIILFLLAIYASGESLATQKTNELREMQLKDGIIELNSTGYFYYTMEFPRPYDIVIYFVAQNCKLCSDLNEQYQKVSKFYADSGALYKSESKRAVFFATMTFNEKTQQVFEQLGFQSAPNLFVSQPHIVFVPQEERERYLRDMKWTISRTDGTVTAHKFLEFINKRTGRQVDYKASATEAFTVIGVLLGALSVGALLFILGRPLFLNSKLWFVGSILIFTICLAGVVYNIIHDVPYFTQNNKGEIQWKTNSGRQQLGFEGLFLSLAMTFVGLTTVLIMKLKVLVKHQKLDPFVERFVYFTLFICIILMISFVEDNYRQKSHYNPIFWPPRHYIKGPLNKDQGNSF